jgi:PAS domain-containing protein
LSSRAIGIPWPSPRTSRNASERHELLRITHFIFDKASFGIFLIKEGGQITDVNEYACQYLGYTKEELCRMNIFEIDQGIIRTG